MRTAILLFTLTGWILAGNAMAATQLACVSNSAELATALSNLASASDNSDANEIRIRTGTYVAPAGGFTAAVTNHHDLTIAGGYLDAACTQQTFDASLTVLDGNHASGVLNIDTVFIPVSDIAVSGLTFQNGSAGSPFQSGVGGLKIGDPNPISGGKILVERNIFRNNSALSNGFSQAVGGLVAATDGDSFIVRDNLFVGNTSPNVAAAYFYSNNEIDVSNNTFTRNEATAGTADTPGLTMDFFTLAPLVLSNNIYWGNVTADHTFDLDLSGTSGASRPATLVSNDIESATGMTQVQTDNTLRVNPLFAHTDDFRLSAVSPLIDAGSETPSGGLASVDLDGAPRVDGIAPDLGAYESSYIFTDGFE